MSQIPRKSQRGGTQSQLAHQVRKDVVVAENRRIQDQARAEMERCLAENTPAVHRRDKKKMF